MFLAFLYVISLFTTTMKRHTNVRFYLYIVWGKEIATLMFFYHFVISIYLQE